MNYIPNYIYQIDMILTDNYSAPLKICNVLIEKCGLKIDSAFETIIRRKNNYILLGQYPGIQTAERTAELDLKRIAYHVTLLPGCICAKT